MKPFAWVMVVVTVALAWAFWFTPAKVQVKPMMLYKSVPGVVEPAAPDMMRKTSSWLDLIGKCTPLVSTGLAFATFMRGRKRKNEHSRL